MKSDDIEDFRAHARSAPDPAFLLRQAADRIVDLILTTDLPEVDVAIQAIKARELCERLLPERLELFDMVYLSRFSRLWNQFRGVPEILNRL